jgi:hypothetical protein
MKGLIWPPKENYSIDKNDSNSMNISFSTDKSDPNPHQQGPSKNF